MSTIEYNGQQRHVAGKINYRTVLPEPGTIIGPNTIGEYMVILGYEDDGVLVGWATRDDVDAARLWLLEGNAPRSTAETKL